MRFVVKLLISIGIIIFCTQVGRKLPTLAGLIAVMPLTGLVVLVWLYVDNPGNFGLMTRLHQRRLVGDFAEHFVFPCGLYMLSEAVIPLDCGLRKLCNLACRSIYSSVVAA